MDKSKVIEVLHDLIRINKDRTERYERAMDELSDNSADITETFLEMARKSQVFKNELSGIVLRLGGPPEGNARGKGKVYKLWSDLRSGGSNKSVLESCEFGEDAALKAYDEALEAGIKYPEEIRKIILNQRELLEDSHETVKQYRDTF